jgi:hypothetical protein
MGSTASTTFRRIVRCFGLLYGATYKGVYAAAARAAI